MDYNWTLVQIGTLLCVKNYKYMHLTTSGGLSTCALLTI
jgi:hypothetical protein